MYGQELSTKIDSAYEDQPGHKESHPTSEPIDQGTVSRHSASSVFGRNSRVSPPHSCDASVWSFMTMCRQSALPSVGIERKNPIGRIVGKCDSFTIDSSTMTIHCQTSEYRN